ncbi:MAG: LysE family translocator [Thiobacillus sp.]
MRAALTMLPDAALAGGPLLALAAYAVAVSVAAGPHTWATLPSGIRPGLHRCGGHLLGLMWGTYLVICLVGVVLGGLFMAAPGAQAVLRVAAGFVLLWVARRLWRNGVPPVVQPRRTPRFGEAVLFQLGNPLAWLVAAGVIVGFVPAGALYLERMLAMALLFCLAALPGVALWALAAGALQRRMRGSPRLRRGMALIAASASVLFWV